MSIDSRRGQIAEFGLIAAQGARKLGDLAERLRAAPAATRPNVANGPARSDRGTPGESPHPPAFDTACHRTSEASRRLQTIPGVGVITATAVAPKVADATVFESARHLAAWVGLSPRQSGAGGKIHPGKISKKGESSFRKLFVLGATALTWYARSRPEIAELPERRPARVAIVAAANKLARIARAAMAGGEGHRGGAVSVS